MKASEIITELYNEMRNKNILDTSRCGERSSLCFKKLVDEGVLKNRLLNIYFNNNCYMPDEHNNHVFTLYSSSDNFTKTFQEKYKNDMELLLDKLEKREEELLREDDC